MSVPGSRVVDVSVLVPAKDEALNLPDFIEQCEEALGPAQFSYEVVVVDDGSRDDSPSILKDLSARYPFLRVVTHRRQRGIADALQSAAAVAAGDVFVFYPADLQYLPKDIPTLVRPILAGDADIVTGTKQGKYERAFVSRIYNRLSRWLFGVNATDLNSVKAYRREIMDLLLREVKLQQVVKLVGPDALPDSQRFILDVCKLFKEAFLQQNAFDDIDRYSTIEKQVRMLHIILTYWRRGSAAIKRGVTLVKLKKLKVYQDILKMKFSVPNDDLSALSKIEGRLERSMDQLESIYV